MSLLEDQFNKSAKHGRSFGLRLPSSLGFTWLIFASSLHSFAALPFSTSLPLSSQQHGKAIAKLQSGHQSARPSASFSARAQFSLHLWLSRCPCTSPGSPSPAPPPCLLDLPPAPLPSLLCYCSAAPCLGLRLPYHQLCSYALWPCSVTP